MRAPRLSIGWTGLPLMLATLCTLAGCDAEAGYHRSLGRWSFGKTTMNVEDSATFRVLDALYARDDRRGYYRGAVVPGSVGTRFAALSEHEASDGGTVWYCNTRREASEYWSVQHLRIDVIRDADAATYRSLGRGYARDRWRVYAKGVPYPVRDVASFEPLAGRFGRDARSGYHALAEIAGSHGPSFEVLDPDQAAYARDRAHAWWGGNDDAPDGRHGPLIRLLAQADPQTLRAPGRDYAVDARSVWYRGLRLQGADPASFRIDDSYVGEADASDRHGRWSRGVRLPASSPR